MVRLSETPLPIWTVAEGTSIPISPSTGGFVPPTESGARFIKFGSVSSVVAHTPTTIWTFTVPPTSTVLIVTGLFVSGTLEGEFFLQINATDQLGLRTSGAARSDKWNGNIDNSIEVLSGQTVRVVVTHPEVGKLGTFYSTGFGRLF